MKKMLLLVSVVVVAITTLQVKGQSTKSKENNQSPSGAIKTKILILGTPHLRHLGKKFSPHFVDSLLIELKQYQPGIIGIESISGAQIAEMERRGETYKSVVQTFAGEALKYGKTMQQNLSISWPKANMMADSLLEQVRDSQEIIDKVRIKLISYLLASYRLNTAVLQWSFLSQKYKSNQAVIPSKISLDLDKRIHSSDEVSSISIRLAHDLGLQQVYPIDDHMDMDELKKITPQLDKALDKSTVQEIKQASYFSQYKQLLDQGIKNKNLLPLYLFMNSPTYFEQDKKIQWQETFLQSNSKLLRKRLALWEVRNLNIAAHIRKASADNIGSRILITIGASHKSFLDTYLKDMMGVQIVNLKDVMRK